MKKCKFYSEEIGKCLFDGSPDDCNENNCTCFEPYEEGVITAQLITDKNNAIDERTLAIQNCDKIILTSKCLEVEVKIEIDNFNEFDYIVINGIKFRREK